MPHLIIDYSGNLDSVLDMADFCDHIRRSAIATGTFPTKGIRVRAIPAPHFSIADGNARHAYIDISIRLRAGRDLDSRQSTTQAIFDAAHQYVADYMAQNPLALSIEMRNIDPDLAPKINNYDAYMDP